MKKFRSILVLMLILAMVLPIAACHETTTTPSATPKESVQPSPAPSDAPSDTTEPSTEDTPQYGGTITVIGWNFSSAEPPGWGIHQSPSIGAAYWLTPVQEYLFEGDILGKGPRGTGESGFNVYQAEIAADLLTGAVCESYEMSADGMLATFHVRPGVMWQGNDNIGMAPREVTAEDVAYWLNTYRTLPRKTRWNR